MYEKGIAVVAITKRGIETALRIKKALGSEGLTSTVYAPEKHSQNGVVPLEKGVDEFFKDTFSTVDALIGVMASGIIIRGVAPLLQSKLTDPAVVGVDAAGKFVVSLLSGHYGGANELARIIAHGIGGTAVITTASDATGKQSVDELASAFQLRILNPQSLVPVNSAIVNGDRLVFVLVGNAEVPLDQLGCYEVKKAETFSEALKIINSFDAGAVVTNEPLPSDIWRIEKVAKPFTVLKTKCLAVGLGARKDSSAGSIVEAVIAALQQANLSLGNVEKLASVDIKKNSPAMTKAAEHLSKPIEFFSVAALRTVSQRGLSPDSKLVQEKIGVGGVCERAAILAAGKKAELILKKTKLNGVTVAIAAGE